MCSRPAAPSPPLPAVQVRQTAVSWDGAIILAACEDGTLWRYDAVKPADGREDEEGQSEDDE